MRFAMGQELSHQDTVRLKELYDSFSLAVERAAATLHIKGLQSDAFRTEDMKCAALWDRIRALADEAPKAS